MRQIDKDITNYKCFTESTIRILRTCTPDREPEVRKQLALESKVLESLEALRAFIDGQ